MDRQIKVLVVDDFSTVRRIIRTFLRQLGIERVEEASDGEEAWQKLQGGGFGLVITDWNMPNVTGLELLLRIRADARFAALPVLMVTAESTRDHIVEAARAGVNQYVVKPFTAEVLRDKLGRIFQRGEG